MNWYTYSLVELLMTDAYIYDVLRTPRGKGRSGGALSETIPVALLATLFKAAMVRYDLAPDAVDDARCGQPLEHDRRRLPV